MREDLGKTLSANPELGIRTTPFGRSFFVMNFNITPYKMMLIVGCYLPEDKTLNVISVFVAFKI